MNITLKTYSLYQNENRLSAKYGLAFLYLDQQDSLNAFSLLDSIPAVFDLSASDLATHDLYVDLFNVIWQNSVDTNGLDSLQIEELFEIAESYPTIPGIYASNMLIREGLWTYEEPVYVPILTKSSPINNPGQISDVATNYLKVFPNPAGNYFIAYYNITNYMNDGVIVISDIIGNDMKSILLKDKQNQVVIPAVEFSPGIYIIRLYTGNDFIDSQKITISR